MNHDLWEEGHCPKRRLFIYFPFKAMRLTGHEALVSCGRVCVSHVTQGVAELKCRSSDRLAQRSLRYVGTCVPIIRRVQRVIHAVYQFNITAG